MSIEVVQIFVKPNVETQWFHDTWPASHLEYIQTMYKNTGKFIGRREISEDGLMLTTTFIFSDENAQFDWMADEYLAGMVIKRDQHNLDNDIFQVT